MIDANYLTRFQETNILIVIIFPVVQAVPERDRWVADLSCPWNGDAGEEVAIKNCVVFLQAATPCRVSCYIRVLFFLKG